MKARTLVTDRKYFGIDPLRLRTATGRALARVVGLSPTRARLSATQLRQDFAVDTIRGTALVNELVKGGLLEEPDAGQAGYRLTEEFFLLAAARVVEPLSRTRARLLLTEACSLAERINEVAVHNPLEIAAFVVYGNFMSRAQQLESLQLGIEVQLRTPSRRTRFGRMQSKADGAEAIRQAMRELSSFVRVRLVTDLQTLPRPFSLVFQASTPPRP
ncbi:MAG: hypothetical protein ABIO63_13755 [Casimicrobiaceae bacterium]